MTTASSCQLLAGGFCVERTKTPEHPFASPCHVWKFQFPSLIMRDMGEWQAGWWGAWSRGSLRGPKAASATHRGVASPQPGPLNFLLTWGSSCQCLASSDLRVKLTFPHLPFKPPDLSLPPFLKETSLSVSLWPSNNPEHTPLLTLLPHLPPFVWVLPSSEAQAGTGLSCQSQPWGGNPPPPSPLLCFQTLPRSGIISIHTLHPF